jgi:hypothetical protein
MIAAHPIFVDSGNSPYGWAGLYIMVYAFQLEFDLRDFIDPLELVFTGSIVGIAGTACVYYGRLRSPLVILVRDWRNQLLAAYRTACRGRQ